MKSHMGRYIIDLIGTSKEEQLELYKQVGSFAFSKCYIYSSANGFNETRIIEGIYFTCQEDNKFNNLPIFIKPCATWDVSNFVNNPETYWYNLSTIRKSKPGGDFLLNQIKE